MITRKYKKLSFGGVGAMGSALESIRQTNKSNPNIFSQSEDTSNIAGIGLSMGANTIDALDSGNQWGRQTVGTTTAKSALQGAATGLAVGGPIGAAIGGIAGGVMGFVNGKKSLLEEQKILKERDNSMRQLSISSTRAMKQSNPYLFTGTRVNTYKFGGKVKKSKLYTTDHEFREFAYGGSLTKLNSKDHLVVGNSHEEGGVKFPQQGIELEGGETKSGNFIFSKALGFADKSLPLMMMKGALENKKGGKGMTKAIDKHLGKLKWEQEATKAQLGIDNDLSSFANGGPIKGQIAKSSSTSVNRNLQFPLATLPKLEGSDFEFIQNTTPKEKQYMQYVSNMSGNPGIQFHDGVDGNIKTGGVLRENYNPFTNTIHLKRGEYNMFSAEAAHARQKKQRGVLSMGLQMVKDIPSYIKGTQYSDEGTMERDAHEDIETQFYNVLDHFVRGKKEEKEKELPTLLGRNRKMALGGPIKPKKEEKTNFRFQNTKDYKNYLAYSKQAGVKYNIPNLMPENDMSEVAGNWKPNLTIDPTRVNNGFEKPITTGTSNVVSEKPVTKNRLRLGNTDRYLPFVTNAVNALRKYPDVPNPVMGTADSLPLANFNAEKANLDNDISLARGQVSSMSSQQQQAVIGSILAKSMAAKNNLTGLESKTNTDIRSRNIQAQNQVGLYNNNLQNNFLNSKLERSLAITSNNQDNLSNSIDKYLEGRQNDIDNALDNKRIDRYSKLFSSAVRNKYNSNRMGGKLTYKK